MAIVTKAMSLILITLLTSCKSPFHSNLELTEFTIDEYAEVESSESIAGVWVGVNRIYESEIDERVVKGSLKVFIVIDGNDNEGFNARNCTGDKSSVEIVDNKISMFDVSMILNSNSSFSGASDPLQLHKVLYSYWAGVGSWEFKKISSKTNLEGSIDYMLASEVSIDAEGSPLSLCYQNELATDKYDKDHQDLAEKIAVSWVSTDENVLYMEYGNSRRVRADYASYKSNYHDALNIPFLEELWLKGNEALDLFQKQGDRYEEASIQLEGESDALGAYTLSVNIDVLVPE